MEQGRARNEQAPTQAAPPVDDAADVARVAQLVGRTGLSLSTAEIAQLVAEYRYDRAGFDRMRTMLADSDETAHTFRAARTMRTTTDGAQVSEARGTAGADAGTSQ